MANTISEISSLDHRILLAGGLTTGTERFRSQLQHAKHSRQTNLLKQNLDLIRENGRLRKEIAYHEDRIKPLLLFYQKYLEMHDSLRGVVEDVARQMKECENGLLEGLGIDISSGCVEDGEWF